MQVQWVDVLEDNMYTSRSAGQHLLSLQSDSDIALDRYRNLITDSWLAREDRQILVRCTFCRCPLYLRRNPGGDGFHFAHYHQANPPDTCPQHQRGQHVHDLRALIHQGVQEGRLHKRLKETIYRLLLSDPFAGPGTVKKESRLTEGNEFRRPDVQAVYNGRLTAFEVQVSRELPDMIAVRQAFYRNRDLRILWVLPGFEPDKANQSQQDIAVTNNHHLFVLDDEAIALSETKRALHLKAWFQWPRLQDNRIVHEWQSRTVPASDIRFRRAHAYVEDVVAEQQRLETIRAEARLAEHQNPATLVADTQTSGNASPLQKDWEGFMDEWQWVAAQIVQAPLSGAAFAALEDGFIASETNPLYVEWFRLHGVDRKTLGHPSFLWKIMTSVRDVQLRWPRQTWKWAYNNLAKHHTRWEKAIFFLLEASCSKAGRGVNPLHAELGDAWYDQKRQELMHRKTQMTPGERRLLALLAPAGRTGYLRDIDPPETFHYLESTPYGYLLGAEGLSVPDFAAKGIEISDPALQRPEEYVTDLIDNRLRLIAGSWLPMPGCRVEPNHARQKVCRLSVEAFSEPLLNEALRVWRHQLNVLSSSTWPD